MQVYHIFCTIGELEWRHTQSVTDHATSGCTGMLQMAVCHQYCFLNNLLITIYYTLKLNHIPSIYIHIKINQNNSNSYHVSTFHK